MLKFKMKMKMMSDDIFFYRIVKEVLKFVELFVELLTRRNGTTLVI